MKAILICFAVLLAAALTEIVPAAPSVAIDAQLRREQRVLSERLDNVQEFSRFVHEVVAERREGKLDSPEASRRVLERVVGALVTVHAEQRASGDPSRGDHVEPGLGVQQKTPAQ